MMPKVTSRRFAGETVHGAAGVLSFAADGTLVGEPTPEVVEWCRKCKDIQVEDRSGTAPVDEAPSEDAAGKFDVATASRRELLEVAKRLHLGLNSTATSKELRVAIAGALEADEQLTGSEE